MTLIQITQECNLNPAICSPCGGACCKMQPGITAPAQWGTNAEEIEANLTTAFATGKWAVDWWEGDTEPDGNLDDVYFVRPAAKNVKNLFHGAARNAVCTFFQEFGCLLLPEARPDMCLSLIPSTSGGCWPPGPYKHENLKGDYAQLWRPYQAQILGAAKQCGFDPDDRDEDSVDWYSLGFHF